MFKSVCVVGAGGWGTALATLVAEKSDHVRLWAHRSETADEINTTRRNSAYLDGVDIPAPVHATANLEEAASGAELVVLVTPSVAVRETARMLASTKLGTNALVVACTKGIEHESGLLMSQLVEQELPGHPVAVLSGPNLAIEIARGVPAACVVGCSKRDLLAPLQDFFSTAMFRAYTSEDVRGIQLGGALKNVFAIAAGVSDGMGLGDNAKAGLVTRALAEMMRLGVSMGGKHETFYGLGGVGDLMVTCFSKHSRNRSFGERLGGGESADAVLASMRMVAEGVPTARSALQCARRLGIEVPIIERVHALIYENESAADGIGALMGRPPRAESDATRTP